jgi:hypothetical protein
MRDHSTPAGMAAATLLPLHTTTVISLQVLHISKLNKTCGSCPCMQVAALADTRRRLCGSY